MKLKTIFTTIKYKENNGIQRTNEPISFGLPFPQSTIKSIDSLVALYSNERLPTQFKTADLWPDGSVKWVFMTVLISIAAGNEIEIVVGESENNSTKKHISVVEERDLFIIQDNNNPIFTINRIGKFSPFPDSITTHQSSQQFNWKVAFTNSDNQHFEASIDFSKIEETGPILTILYFQGTLKSTNHHLTQYIARIYIYNTIQLIKVDFKLFNPNAARHPGNVWDLGDEGSIFFKRLSFDLLLENSNQKMLTFKAHYKKSFQHSESVTITQQSSGGNNWNSTNHIDKDKKLHRVIKGGSIKTPQTVIQDNRLQPTINLTYSDVTFSIALKEFWQNFPKSIECDGSKLSISLFPEQENEQYELQGGESKTHTIFMSIGSQNLDWISNPLIPIYNPEWIKKCLIYNYFTTPSPDDTTEYFNYINAAINDDTSFFHRREIIDEYGWRNFGELYADHESRYNSPEKPYISHYNNQYDCVHWGLVHFLRSGNTEWFKLSHDLARHVRDIDVYHTTWDRFEYNGGLFWHTNHYFDASTSTHRCYSKDHKVNNTPLSGGPSPQNCYVHGLLLHYYLTTDPFSLDAFKLVCQNVLHLIKGPKHPVNKIKYLSKRVAKSLKKKLNRSLEPYNLFDGPGRESANALAALCCGYTCTKDPDYIKQAEKLISICIARNDTIEKHSLWNVEMRWSYVMFLQSIGMYIDLKRSINQTDKKYLFAYNLFFRYVDWMVEHEVPYFSKKETLEYPNETWAAQELRKASVFFYAAVNTKTNKRNLYLTCGKKFFNQAFSDLESFGEYKLLTRPIVIAMGNGLLHEYAKGL